MTNESLVMEVAEWLETAAHDTHDFERIAKAVIRGLEAKPTDGSTPVHRFAIAIGICGNSPPKDITAIRYTSQHLVKRFQATTGLTDDDMAALKKWLATIPDENIKIDFETIENKEWLCLHQTRYVPTDQREGILLELAFLFARVAALGKNPSNGTPLDSRMQP